MRRRAGVCGGLALFASVTIARQAAAELDVDINLMSSAPHVPPVSMADYRWASFPIGPTHLKLQVFDETKGVVMGRCGCMLAGLDAVTHAVVPVQAPWFNHQQVVYSPGEGFSFDYSFSFSPKYIDDWLNIGPNPDKPRESGWGFESGGGTHCGVRVWPWALSLLAETDDVFTTGGFTWVLRESWTPATSAKVDDALMRGLPSLVGYAPPGYGGHVNVIVGWDNARKKYLTWDVVRNPGSIDPKDLARIAGYGWYPPNNFTINMASEEQGYTEFFNAVQYVVVPEPYDAASTLPSWMYLADDPEPIQLRLTDPRGRQTGIDPETGEEVQEDDSAFYSELTSFTDPLLLIPESEPHRYVAVKNPEVGSYGLEVIGIGDGPFTLTLGTVDIDQMKDVATVTGDIVEGEVKRYEIVRAANGSVAIDAVAAFEPRARCGNDASAFIGGDVAFDGRGSYEIGGEIATYDWDFGDGTSGSGAQQSHAYALAGVYTATLTVTNADGLSATDERNILVIDPASLPQMETLRVSETSTNLQANGISVSPEVSDDGRYVAFMSTAPNFLVGDTNLSQDIFVKDLSEGTVERVSVATGGAQAISGLGFALMQNLPWISADGRFVTFVSDAPNLFAGDDELTGDLFVHDREQGTTELLYDAPGSGAYGGELSTDGRYLVYATASYDLYWLDRQTGVLEQVNVNDAGEEANDESQLTHISADGNLILFQSEATNLDSASPGARSVFLRNVALGTTELVSLDNTGSPVFGNFQNIFSSSMSDDGRYVTFSTSDNDVVPGDNNAGSGDVDVFVRDRLLGTTEHISVSTLGEGANRIAAWEAISADGRYVAFVSAANNLAPGGTFALQAYLRDRQEQTTVRVSVDNNGVEATNPGVVAGDSSTSLSVALDGSVAFGSIAANLVLNDTNGTPDVFIRRVVPRSGGATTPISNLGGPYLGWASSDAIPAAIRLDGSGSADPQDRPLSARWDFGDGSPVFDGDLVATHAYAKPGVYTVSLTVSADSDTSEVITTEVEVMPALVPDALNVDFCVAPGDELVIGGAAVSANQALIAEGWDTSTGKIPLNAAVIMLPWGDVSATPKLPGLDFRKKVGVPVDVGEGSQQALMGTVDAAFVVPCPQRPQGVPLAAAGGPIYEAQAGAPVVLDGSESTDDEGSELTYFWDFGDDTSGEGATPSHTYRSPGLYMVTLIVNDGTESSAAVIGTRSFAMVTVTASADEPAANDDEDGCDCDCATSSSRPERSWLGAGLALLAVLRRRSLRSSKKRLAALVESR